MKPEELRNKMNELGKDLMKQTAQVAVGTTPKSPKQIKQLRKSIARIKTELNRQEK